MNVTDGAMQKSRQDQPGGFLMAQCTLHSDLSSHAIGIHIIDGVAGDELAALQDEVIVCPFLRKVVRLLNQKSGYAAAIVQHANNAADGLDDAGLYAFGWLVENRHGTDSGQPCL